MKTKLFKIYMLRVFISPVKHSPGNGTNCSVYSSAAVAP